MHRVIVIDRNLAEIQRLLGDDIEWSAVGRGGLVSAVLSSENYETIRSRSAQPALGVDSDRPMLTAHLASPHVVQGAPMDYHGQGTPLPSLRQLEPRLRKTSDNGTGEGVLVGVVDTGMHSHPWLDGGFLAAPADFEPYAAAGRDAGGAGGPSAEESVSQEVGHATFVTGLILQQAPAAGVWIERALDRSGLGITSSVAEAANTLARRGVDILNLSLGCFSGDPASRRVMQRLVEDLRRTHPDMVIVAAAGNIDGSGDNPQAPADFWPAALDEVVAVGSVDSPTSSAWSAWSNRGEWIDLAAPGYRLLSTYVDGPVAIPSKPEPVRYAGWARWSGTSFSTAVVSGAIARLMTERSVSATKAVTLLRAGALSHGRRTAIEGGAPSVPVVAPRSWRDTLRPDDSGPSD